VLRKSICYLVLLGGFYALRAADEQQMALALRAHTDFDRVQQVPRPDLPDTTRCEQSQAAWLPVATPADLTQAHFQKGYCTLAEAAITRSPAEFLQAAADFDEAAKAWPARAFRPGRNHTVEPVPSPLRLLGPIARLEAAVLSAGNEDPHPDAAEIEHARAAIAPAIDHPVCANDLMPAPACESLLDTGRLWLGWIALQHDDLYEAARLLSALPDSGWARDASGKRAFHDRQFPEAAAEFGHAIDAWTRAQSDSSASLAARLAPQPDRANALEDWGGAQLLAGDVSKAISTLDSAVKIAPNPARALFLRARAEELAGRMEPAMADYSLAARTSLAHAQNLASGEAHLYRGILLYRRKDFEHAENEFASALNFEIPNGLRPDAISWRHMAAVAGGACGSRAMLEDSLGAVSPYFPKDEARSAASSCPLTSATVTNAAI
jgi:tetratricopeptide (TPR) repeat protein